MAFGAAMGLGALGSVIGGIGSIFQGNAESAAMNYQAGIATQNANIAKQNAAWASSAGENQAEQSGMKTAAQVGQITADRAASNLDIKSGSNTEVVAGQREIGQMDQDAIRSNAYKQAYGYNIEAAGEENQANLDKSGAANAQTAGGLGMVSSLIGGATSVATKWMQGQQFGVSGANYFSV
jgi:hypothetical protein